MTRNCLFHMKFWVIRGIPVVLLVNSESFFLQLLNSFHIFQMTCYIVNKFS